MDAQAWNRRLDPKGPPSPASALSVGSDAEPILDSNPRRDPLPIGIVAPFPHLTVTRRRPSTNHTPPGSDPIANVSGRPLRLPLTDAWIEYWSGTGRTTQSIGTIIANREQVDSMRVVTDEDLCGGLLRPAPTPGSNGVPNR
jgi:hypothetical protein